MKSVVVALSLVAAVAAQDLAALAQCGQTCANNMMSPAKVAELGCKSNDLKCLCSNVNFLYGLRDCSRAICSEQDANKVVEYGMKACHGAGVVVTGGNGGASQSGGASHSGGASQSGGNTGAQVTTIYSTATGTDGKVITTPVATSTIEGGSSDHNGSAHVTTLYSTATGTDGQVITTPIATSTIEGGNGGNGGAGGAILSTYTTDGSQVVVTLSTQMSQPSGSGTESGSASQTPSEGASTTAMTSATTSAGSQSSEAAPSTTSTSSGFAAHITAAPGLLAAAGLAALLI